MEDLIQTRKRENEEVQKTLRQKEEVLEDEINDTFSKIAAILEERRQDVLAQLKSRVNGKFQKLENQIEFLETLSGKLSNGEDTLCPELKTLVVAETPHVTINWNGLEDVKVGAGTLGEVGSSSCIPSLSTLDGEGCFKSIVFKQSIMTLTTRNSNGDATPGPSLSDITCHIEPTTALEVSTLSRLINVQVIAVTSSEFDIVYSLPMEGRYRMWVRIYSRDVKNSPFIVMCLADNVKRKCSRSQSSAIPRPRTSSGLRLRSRQSTPCRSRPVSVTSLSSVRRSARSSSGGQHSNVSGDSDLLMVLGGKGRGLGEFMNPQGVASTARGHILVTDSNNQNVQMFTSSGELICRWGTRGRLPGQLQRPTGIAVTGNGSIAISDYENKWVSIFDVDGKFLTKYGAGKLLGPKGLALNKHGELVAVDNKGCSVLVFSQEGKINRKFGSRGPGVEQFAGPHYVSVNSHDNILVSDFHNHCVKVFTREGQFLFSFGSKGEGNGQFNGPTGIAVDALDNIIVADWGNSRIQIFDQYGSFLSFVNTDEFKIHGPQGISLSSESNIILSDSGNHCVKIFKYLS